jgi:hypothetical protein
MKKNKVRVRLRDIHIEDKSSIHYARWVVKDTFQCWLGREELTKIVSMIERGHTFNKRLKYKIKAKT